MPQFNLLSKETALSLTSIRDGETKLGEELTYLTKLDELWQMKPTVVLLGISESIGPRANLGKAGAENAWKAFLDAFLNVQHNRFLDKTNIIVLGHFSCDDLEPTDNIAQLRRYVQRIDDAVYPLIKSIIDAGHTPVVIGGGHNNCYPIIKGVSLSKNKKIDCINIDPHADFRHFEGRHSGNGFSYAYNDGLLHQYSVFGLHESYNSSYILEQFSQNDLLSFVTYETLLKSKINKLNSLNQMLTQMKAHFLGIEIDLDCMAFMPSSAFTPSGFSVEQVRTFLREILKSKSPHYLHLCEGAPKNEQEAIIVGKTLSYLVTDFIKHLK